MDDKEQKEIFAENIERILKEKGLQKKDVAEQLGVSPAAFTKWCKGDSLPRMGKVQMLSDILGVSKSDLIDKRTTEAKPGDAVLIPVFGKVAAGIPFEAVEDIIDYEEISGQMAKTGEFFALQIQGDSMSPRICDRDVVIVKKQSDAESGDVVIALIEQQDACCKRLKKYYDGTIELISNNPSYPALVFEKEKVKNVIIIGKVVELRGKF